MIKIVVAYNKHRVIGVDGQIPWKIKEDMYHFKRTTEHHVCIMGRKTWDSLPPRFRPLPDRINIVVSRNPTLNVNAHGVQSSIEFAMDLASKHWPDRNICIIGGGEIYKQALDAGLVDEVVASEVKGYDDVSSGVLFPTLHGWKGEVVFEHDTFNIVKYLKE